MKYPGDVQYKNLKMALSTLQKCTVHSLIPIQKLKTCRKLTDEEKQLLITNQPRH